MIFQARSLGLQLNGAADKPPRKFEAIPSTLATPKSSPILTDAFFRLSALKALEMRAYSRDLSP